MRRFFSIKQPFDCLLVVSVLILLGLQLLFTLSQLERLRIEDLAESVRSPYWWYHRTVFNGVSSSIGYYVLLNSVYKIFGFSLYMAKWVRLAIHLLSLVAVAILLKRWMGAKFALIPLWIAGSSPTWLFFNSNQAQFGIDLQLFPLVLLAVVYLPLKRSIQVYFFAALLGAFFVWGALIYPTTLFYLPPLVLWIGWRLWNQKSDFCFVLRITFVFMLGFMLPVVAAFLYVKNPQLLIYDPVFKSGLFRGGGRGFTKQPAVIMEHYLTVLRDLFIKPNSYCFDLPRAEFEHTKVEVQRSMVEFQNVLSRIGFFSVILSSFWYLRRLWRERKTGFLNLLAHPQYAIFLWLSFSALFFLHVPQVIATFPGIRRVTGFLFAYYGLVACFWYFAFCRTDFRTFRSLIVLGVLASLAGNILACHTNLTAFWHEDVADKNITFFRTLKNPKESLLYWEQQTREGKALHCDQFEFSSCRYPEIFAAIQSYRLWEKKAPAEVRGWDPYQKRERVLDISIWENNEWPNF